MNYGLWHDDTDCGAMPHQQVEGTRVANAFPFSAIVAQDDMKRALIVAAIDMSLGGVLVLGDRGTGKSTGVRALAGLLPPMQVREDCVFGCAPDDACSNCASSASVTMREVPVPVVDLPLGATEDRITGGIDLERALASGEKHFEPGLLAKANRGFLYIDEINLLEDHLVDLLLDVAASGENVVEREGLSVRHPARFVLVGSGNPEEGELRPQLLDRFGLSVDVTTPNDIDQRIAIVRRRDAFERDPVAFIEQWSENDASHRDDIVHARARLNDTIIPDPLMRQISEICMALGTDGLRGELTLMKSSRALAAYEGVDTVTVSHVSSMAPSALRHRLRRDPLDESGSTVRVERVIEKVLSA